MTDQPGTVPMAVRRRERARRATSDELVSAALRVIAREGVAAATTRKIADEAGVPLGSVHYWYTDKHELLADVVHAVVQRLEGAAASGGAGGGTTEEKVRRGLQAAWSEIATDDRGAQLGLYELTALALRTPGMEHLAREQYAGYRAMAARSLAPVLSVDSGPRAALITQLLCAAFDGLCLAWLADPEGTRPDEVLDLLAEILTPALPQPE